MISLTADARKRGEDHVCVLDMILKKSNERRLYTHVRAETKRNQEHIQVLKRRGSQHTLPKPAAQNVCSGRQKN
jgi:hypothetical protein